MHNGAHVYRCRLFTSDGLVGTCQCIDSTLVRSAELACAYRQNMPRASRNHAEAAAFPGQQSTHRARELIMSIKTMEDLFVATLKDIYYAEKQILKALPGMAKKAVAPKLKEAFETHRQETEAQVERLEKVFKMLDVAPRGKKCEAIEGIIDEAKEHMDEIEDDEILDSSMIGSAQAVEHYEITRYGTLIAWAKQLGNTDAIGLLEENLKEEKHA